MRYLIVCGKQAVLSLPISSIYYFVRILQNPLFCKGVPWIVPFSDSDSGVMAQEDCTAVARRLDQNAKTHRYRSH